MAAECKSCGAAADKALHLLRTHTLQACALVKQHPSYSTSHASFTGTVHCIELSARALEMVPFFQQDANAQLAVGQDDASRENDEPTCLRKNTGEYALAGGSKLSPVRQIELRVDAIAAVPESAA